jgi:hypothetical protein
MQTTKLGAEQEVAEVQLRLQDHLGVVVAEGGVEDEEEAGEASNTTLLLVAIVFLA